MGKEMWGRSAGVLFALAMLIRVPDTHGNGNGAAERSAEGSSIMALHSPYFRAGGELPAYFTCDGPNVSPSLRWNMPKGGKSAALVLEDLTAATSGGPTIHWVAWDIQGEAIEVSQKLNYEGESDFKSTAGYHGPCPTAGCQIQYCNAKIIEHTYRFTVVAVAVSSLTHSIMSPSDEPPLLRAWSKWEKVEDVLKGHEVAQDTLLFAVARATLLFTYRRGAPMVTLPPKVPEIAPGSAEVGGGRVSVEMTQEPVELTKDAGTKDAGTTKGNPQLSKKYAPELLCYSCWQVVQVLERGLKSSMFVKSDARAKREQATAIAEELEGVCDQDNFLKSAFPPQQVANACQYLVHEAGGDTHVERVFMAFRGAQRREQLCAVGTGACRGYTEDEIAELGSSSEAEEVDSMGRRWVRKAVCSEGFEFRENECRPVEGEGVGLGLERGAGMTGDVSQGLEGGKGEEVVERENEKPEL